MLRLTLGKLGLWAAMVIAIFFVFSWLIPEPPFISLLNGVFFGVSVAVAIVYSPLILASFRAKEFDRASQLSMGIGLIWASAFMLRVWATYNRYFGDINAVVNSTPTAFFVYTAIIGGSLFVIAPGYAPGPPPPKFMGDNRTLLLILGAIGGLTTFFAYLSLVPRF